MVESDISYLWFAQSVQLKATQIQSLDSTARYASCIPYENRQKEMDIVSSIYI